MIIKGTCIYFMSANLPMAAVLRGVDQYEVTESDIFM
jgi:hypothetical protein